jgi:hypothetical protein
VEGITPRREPSEEALQAPIVEELLPDDEPANERVREAVLAASLAAVDSSELIVPVLEGGRVEEELPSDDELLVVRRPITAVGVGLAPASGQPGNREGSRLISTYLHRKAFAQHSRRTRNRYVGRGGCPNV